MEKQWKQWPTLFLGGSKITADCDHSHEIKSLLLLGRKAITNLDSVLKSRDITFLTKVCIVKVMGFPVVMYRCESWTMKAECQRNDVFKLWCWRRLLRVPWSSRRSNQSILKEISLNIHWKDWCWSWSSNTPDAKSWLIRKDPDAGKDWGQEKKGEDEMDEMVGWHHQLNRHEFEQSPGDSEGPGNLVCCSSWGCKESDTWHLTSP